MAYTDHQFQLGMSYTLNYRSKNMSRTKDFYHEVENLVFKAIEDGANTTDEIHSYVSQYVPASLISYQLVEDIAIEYSSTDYEPDNVY